MKIQVSFSLFIVHFSRRSFSHRLSGKMRGEGYNVFKIPLENRGISFSEQERVELGLECLLPAGTPESLYTKVRVSMGLLRQKPTGIERYKYLHAIRESDENLFYGMLAFRPNETLPVLDSPTVGQACLEWSRMYRERCSPRGLYLAVKHLGRIESILHNYPNKEIKVIVLTDGERILGLGDLGANGMGIPIGKLALYTACAGIHPEQVLPVTIDVGSDSDFVRGDPAYIGIRQKRDRSENYDNLIEEFVSAAQKIYGRSVVFHFEGFSKVNSHRLQERYRNNAAIIIENKGATGALVLAGLLASNQLTGKNKLSEHRFLFLGAGEAGTGTADLIASTIVQESPELTLKEAKERSFFVDSKGMVCSERMDLEHHKLPFAHDLKTLLGYNGPGFVYLFVSVSLSVLSFFFSPFFFFFHSSFLAL
jgi:malate dehydrogenase (oxaloacetate-decarboxylating)(NADP+)